MSRGGTDDPGADLVHAVGRTSNALLALLSHPAVASDSRAAELRGACEDVARRLRRAGLVVAVVGEQKAGKSTFLNALLGAPILGTGAGAATAGALVGSLVLPVVGTAVGGAMGAAAGWVAGLWWSQGTSAQQARDGVLAAKAAALADLERRKPRLRQAVHDGAFAVLDDVVRRNADRIERLRAVQQAERDRARASLDGLQTVRARLAVVSQRLDWARGAAVAASAGLCATPPPTVDRHRASPSS